MRTFNDHADHDAVTFRSGHAGDGRSLERLAGMDSARPLQGPVVVAEVGGEIRAAVSLETGRHIADPFHRTAALVAVLDLWRRSSAPGKGPHAARNRLGFRNPMYRRPVLALHERLR
jgi:hypothetical protein